MPFVFNTSFYVADAQQQQWATWLHQAMIPAVENVMPGIDHEVFQVVSVNQDDNTLFSVQWRCADVEQVQDLDECIAGLLAELPKRFGEQVTHFSSIMKKL